MLFCIYIASFFLYAVMVQLPPLGKRELVFFCYCLHVVLWFLFREGFSASWYLGWAALFIVALPGSSVNYFTYVFVIV